MKKARITFLSILLSAVITIFSQPGFAIQDINEKTPANGQVSVDVTSKEIQSVSIDDIKTMQYKDSGINDFKGNFIAKSDAGLELDKKYSLDQAASGPDLAIGNLEVATPTQPFPYSDYVSFSMLVGNVGNQSISNVKVTTYVDGTQFYVDTFGTFAAGFGGTYTIPLKGLCGSHQIKFTISGGSVETDATNNSLINTFTWQNVIDLVAIAPTQVDDPIVCGEEFSVKAPIANYGNLPSTNVPINFELAGTNAGSTTLDIPAMTQKTLTLRVTYNNAGGGQLTVKVDKNNTINDADRSNNSVTKQFNVTPEAIGKYKNATNIKIGLAPSTRDLLDGVGEHLSFSDVKTAMTRWNGITSKCNIGYVATVNSEEPNDCDIVVNTFSGDPSDGTTAQTSYSVTGNIIDPELRAMSLNRYYFDNNSDFGSEKMKRTLTHETGHVFGLDHPECGSIAIMQQSRYFDEGLASYNIEFHDSNSLKCLYS